MSDPNLGQYDFLAWVRRGVVANLANADPLSGNLPHRGKLPVNVTVQATLGNKPVPVKQPSVPIEVYGPGDVIGIDPRHIIRTEPGHLTANFEPNYFAGIEFDHPDFPWLFTPAGPNADHLPPPTDTTQPYGDRLRPWISLIVLAPGEFEESKQAPHPLPAINVKSIAVLPDLSESWAWAHAQVSGGMGTGSLAQNMITNPGIAFSRLLCARRLLPDTTYTAFLVPAFDLGMLAGLGQDVPSGDTVEVKPAWTAQTPVPLALPVYFRFEFHTSLQGDFESLVRQLLPPKILPGTVGQRMMDVHNVDWGTTLDAGTEPLGMNGALHSKASVLTDWKDPAKSNFQNDLTQLLNKTTPDIYDPQKTDQGPDPHVVPPMYGRWHAAVQQITANAPAWLSQLNLDPRPRSAAGLGTQIVQQELTQLMASAWNQLGSIEQANQKLRQAQMARSSLLQLHAQHLHVAPTETLLSLTTMVHSRLPDSPMTTQAAIVGGPPKTIRATIAQSRLPHRALSAPFRSVAAPRRQVRLRQLANLPVIEAPRIGATAAPGILTRLNTGDIAPVPPVHAPGGMVALDEISHGMSYSILTPQVFTSIPPQPTFVILSPGQLVSPGQLPPVLVAAGGDSPEAKAFRQAAIETATALQALPSDSAPPAPANLAVLQATLINRLDPNITVAQRFSTLVSTGIQQGTDDPLDPIMAAPEFPQPMYEPLRDLSQDYLLPGVEAVDPNTIGLLIEDHAFIEAYMVGLNHEMARQLLWNGYPTDQRGSYFRQFWDVRSYVPAPGETPGQLIEKLKDIPPIRRDRWLLTNNLGDNKNRTDIVKDNVVLLVRGELLRRYPNTVVYACQAKLKDGKRTLGDQEMHILFRGTLSPDLTFFGFNLTAQVALGTPGSSDPNQQGWFFVLQQPPSEPRFGLEPAPDPYEIKQVPEWNLLRWSNFATTAAALDALTFAPVNAQPQNVALTNPDDNKNKWGTNAAQMAYITFRRPVRVAIHADTMLPQ